MRVLYLDCFAGISGDMTLGAFIDLGVDPAWLQDELKKLNLGGYTLEVSEAEKKGIHGTRCHVRLTDAQGHELEDPGLVGHGESGHHHEHTHHHHHEHPHTHEHQHDHGHTHDHEHHHQHSHHEHPQHEHEHAHQHEHSHDHGHPHEHPHGDPGHHHTGYADIRRLIEGSGLDSAVQKLALGIFHRIARAEAKVHGKTVDTVHFHEVGAVDSIVDIVGAALCIHNLAPDRIYCSPVHAGSGFVKCAHGMMPVPAPATLEVFSESNLIPYSTQLKGEFTTPTGAAILAEVAAPTSGFPAMKTLKVGYGAGHKDFEIPNMLRAVLGEMPDAIDRPIRVLEANMDDITGEEAGYALEKLMAAGALDACYTPVFMKKNRPGILLTVLCEAEKEAELEALMLKETTTLGLRKYSAERTTMHRSIETADTPWGPVRVKTAVWNEVVKQTPEYEDCRRIAEETGVPLREVMNQVMRSIAK